MMRLGVAASLWAVFAFVTWNVVFDRHVMVSAVEFTRDQVLRHQNGAAPITVHEGFSPRVREAAVRATLSIVPVIAAAAITLFLTFRRGR